jgi:hypothetical protein
MTEPPGKRPWKLLNKNPDGPHSEFGSVGEDKKYIILNILLRVY